MIDFIEYVVAELKSKRLSRDNAVSLVRQFSGKAAGAPILHPLLHANVSDLHQQCYRSSFDGEEFFLRDHQLAGGDAAPSKVLPGVCYLEMARAAVADALPDTGAADQIQLTDVVWLKPAVADAPIALSVALFAGARENDVEFEIFSVEAGAEGEHAQTLHCRGVARRGRFQAPPRIDIATLGQRGGAGVLGGAEVYALYRGMGMQFGPAHRPIETLMPAEGEVFARLALPAVVDGTLAQYMLHPSLLDGALQAALGLLHGQQARPSLPSVPFALASMRAFGGCTPRMYAWVRHAAGSGPDSKVASLDIDLCDELGTVCVELRGLSSRTLAADGRDQARPDALRLVLAAPAWQPGPAGQGTAAVPRATEHHVLLCGFGGGAAWDRERLPHARVLELDAQGGDIGDGFARIALACFDAVRRILEERGGDRLLIQLVVPDADGANPAVALSGLLKSAALEHPALTAQLLVLDRTAVAALPEVLLGETGADAVVRHRAGVREVRGLRELEEGAAMPGMPLREDGVYVVTGGLGGLGRLFAAEILRQCASAHVILTGRATPSEAVLAEVGALGGARVQYRVLDLLDPGQVRQLVADVLAVHGRLNGIIHSAGMIADKLILNKPVEEFAAVLAPKVAGTVNLDLASHGVDLDFLALFSSGASLMGNVGQSDYSVANGFLDVFAAYRNGLAQAGERHGRTVAINWPLWADGGMRMPQHARDAMRSATGMHPMRTETGMRAFYHCLTGEQQTVVIEGQPDRIRQALFGAPVSLAGSAPAAGQPAIPAQPDAGLEEATRDYLRRQFSALLRLPYHKVDPATAFARYGVDSILAMDLTAQLEKRFGPLAKTLFFEYQSVDELGAYFMREHRSALEALVAPAEAPSLARPEPEAREHARRRAVRPATTPPGQGGRPEPIAIVGLSGRYPESPDLEAFWRNLREGKDCIVEVPRERWDWREYYSEDRSAAGAHYSKWGGFIAGVDEFDPLFFNIPPVDAELIDPQERLFLQHAWMAVEDAGYTRSSLKAVQGGGQAGQVGVYVGVMYGEYQLFGAEASLQGERMGVPVSYASIANRVSYVLDLHGPSMTLDTMCSSSLTAIHLACQDLKLGRTGLAIAGGVNVTVHPNKYLILSAGQYISGDGHCQSFGEGGDGYIPGEGVGSVVLKRLSDAQRDGNHIYGVIKGSALNHGGRTSGYSVPNPKAQGSVIGLALREYDIDARHVSYVEAHGTGTRLGDPIEVAALSQVFGESGVAAQSCALGSAKSNIGHCESAAGIAGLTKVLLQMKHRLIVPSLHSSVLNPYIDFAATPFYVNQALRPWEPPVVDGAPVARIAGISSFGAGGSNAHMIVEEYTGASAASGPAGEAVLVPLSARTAGQLKRKAEDLAAFVRRHEGALDLQSLAYTLQVGREAMDARLALVVTGTAQLADKLDAVVAGELAIEQCYQGQVAQDREGVSVLGRDEDMAEAIGKWMSRRKLAKLADLWVQGLELDWRLLYRANRPSLISLPAYPFARDRYWLGRPAAPGPGVARAPALHPLVHANTSDLYQQCYTSEFYGDEFFLADHQIAADGGASLKMLPAVAYLEMARAALALALRGHEGARRVEIRNVAWSQPIVVAGRQRVAIALSPAGGDKVDFEVLTGVEDGQHRQVHCQGQAEVGPAAAPARLDLEALEARMTGSALPVERLYDDYARLGIHYGPSFRCIAALRTGRGEALAELALPGGEEHAANDYDLHPGLLDSALQASIGLLADPAGLADGAAVPFALDSLALLAPCAPRMLAWVREAPQAADGDGITKIDIDLCDPDGRLCVTLRGLAARALGNGTRPDQTGTLLAYPAWEALSAGVAPATALRHHVLLCGLPGIDPTALAGALPGAQVRTAALDSADGSAGRYRSAAIGCFEAVQALLRQAPRQQVVFQLAVPDENDDALLAGLAGLVDTARLENPNLIGQLVLAAPGSGEDALAGQLRDSLAHSAESVVRHDGGIASALRWKPGPAPGGAAIGFRPGGVYLITGGLGGLGMLFAREILARAEGAVVVLGGRATRGARQDAKLAPVAAQLGATGRLVYRQLDLCRLDQVEGLVASVIAEFGALDGILHSAGMHRDGLIVNQSVEDFAAVLEPKVSGTVNLDLATRATGVDFLVLFSSLASAFGNPGQAAYAAANGFLDQFAGWRNRMVASGERRGATLSINWPLWQEGGMQVDAQTRELLAVGAGMLPMSTASGMRAFHQALECANSQVLVAEGHLERLRRALNRRHAPIAPLAVSAHGAEAAPRAGVDHLAEKAQAFLAREFARTLKIPPHEVDPKAPLEKYGMDSVLAMRLTNQLEQIFGSLSKTLFFEYQSIASLAAYLVKAFPGQVREHAGGISTAAQPALLPAEPAAVPAPRRVARLAPSRAPEAQDVAIVGVAGRYPGARDLREFWDNLAAARDCITEIPGERWDHTRFYHPERNRPGTSYSKWGGFLDGVDRFDALFFNISPKEAELIDPQERLFIETVWEAIEDAGYGKEAIAQNRVGVYVGAMWGHYELYGGGDGAGTPSSSFASIANRVSYFFNFHGPSLALDTMCSSSLTAIHLACEEVRKDALDVAIAGGVNLSLHPHKYLSLSQGNFASSEGRCRSFGEGGDGYVPGEGVGVVVLKPLEKALADGDQVYAIVRAGAINHGGKTNGYTVPNPIAQADLVRQVLDKAKLDPASIGYIETHGTGTALGDPIEIAGLVRAFEGGGPAAARLACPIGSVKSNIGHLEAAAGIAAVTKVLLQFKHRQLVPSLHAERLNPHIDFGAGAFRVQRTLDDWPRPRHHPRRAAVSSFGAGGSNAHLILEEYEAAGVPGQRDDGPQVFVLSAKNRAGLVAYAQRMAGFLDLAPGLALADVAFTSQAGRTAMPDRLAVVAGSTAELAGRLHQWLRESSGASVQGRNVDAGDNIHEGNVRDRRLGPQALIQGEAGSAFIEATLARRDLGTLARLWVGGIEVDWARLHAGTRARRVSLPTYPFARERHWIAAPATRESTAGQAAQAGPAAPRQMLFYRPQWSAAPLAVARPEAGPAGALLLLGAPAALAAHLDPGHSGAPLVRVDHAGRFAQEPGQRYRLDFGSQQDFDRLVAELAAAGAVPRTVVHVAQAHGDTDEQLEHGLFAVHHLCRALMKHLPPEGVRIVCVQQGAQFANAALHRALAGYFKSLALEHPGFSWKVMSLESVAAGELESTVLPELDPAQWRDEELRYQRGPEGLRRMRRHIAAFAPQSGPIPLKQRGVYVVTGGLGGLGYIFSEMLARMYRARLVLTGRSALGTQGRARLAALADLGGEAIYVQADVADSAQARAVVTEAKRHFAGINGIVHSAGVHDDGFVLAKTRERMAPVLAAKVKGTLNLDLATSHEQLDLFVLFSSIAGVAGNAGQCDYAFANGFMDAFAEQRQAAVEAGARTGRTLAINWPFWQAGGMRLSEGEVALMERRTGIASLPTQLGIEYWDSFLQSEQTQGIALYGDAERIASYLEGGRAPRAAPVRGTASAATAATSVDGAALHAAAQAYLKGLLGEQVKLAAERIDPYEPLETFGVDSMMIGRMNLRLEQELGALPKTLFYEYATIDELAGYLAANVGTALALHCGLAPGSDAATACENAHAPRLEQGAAAPAPAGAPGAGDKFAIVGVHVQLPQAATLDAFWDKLKEGRDLIDVVPASRWDAEAFFDADPARADEGRIYCKWGGFLDDVDKFDAAFFGIAAQDARLIDPQERLFIQSVWSAIEDAGYTRDSLKRRHPRARSADVGVFAGVTSNTYHLLAHDAASGGDVARPASLPWSIANRVSYFFDFQGPSMPVDTACSSALVAIHLACESLARRECQVAVAGAVNLYLHPSKYHSFCRRRMLAADRHCRSFGAGDDGFVPGEGVGAFVVKPLARAVADGDHVYAVIAASASAHGGRANGYSAPNPGSQAALIGEVMDKAGAHPLSIGYVEGHGTGTALGDSLEVAALTQAFERRGQRARCCALGSVKSNVGHAESAAGIAAVAKVLLQLRHRELVPTLHSGTANPNIDFDNSPFYLQHERAPWQAVDGQPRRALVNSFGAGGVNACLMLEEFEHAPAPAEAGGPHLVLLSARNEGRLRQAAQRLRDRVRSDGAIDMRRLAYTLQAGREAMEQRMAIIASNAGELGAALDAFLSGQAVPELVAGRADPQRRKQRREQGDLAAGRQQFAGAGLEALARRWVEGDTPDWEGMHGADSPGRLPLPAYPFAGERHWVTRESVAAGPGQDTQAQAGLRLHPLLAHNASTLREVCFSSSLSEGAYYGRDHRVNGQSLFPGAGFLELACASGAVAGEQAVTRLEDIVWSQPLALTGTDLPVRTILKANGENAEFVIVSFDEDYERVLHSEGRVCYGPSGGRYGAPREPLDIAGLKTKAASLIAGEDFYRRLQGAGLAYGPSFQTVQELYAGDGFALSRLRLAESLEADADAYLLHPCLVDGAFQTVAGIVSGDMPDAPQVPFALDEVEILGPLGAACYAYVEQAPGGAQPDIRQFTICLLNEAGQVLVRMNNFYVRALGATIRNRREQAGGLALAD